MTIEGWPVINRILPACIDNRYRGHRLALWLFVPITLQKVAQSFVHLLSADGGAQSLSTIPLHTYSPSAAQNVVGLFARMGLVQLVLASLLVLVLVRYRAMIPLMYFLIVAQFLASQVVSEVKPLVLARTSAVSVPLLVFAVLSAIGLVLSLAGPGYANQRTPRSP